jgi:hypothetical protein
LGYPSPTALESLAPCDLGGLVSDGLGLLRLTLPRTISVQVAIEPELDQVLVSEMAAHQLLTLLVGGAARGLAADSTLRVSLEALTVGTGVPPPHAELGEGRYLCFAVEALPAGRYREPEEWSVDVGIAARILRSHGGASVAEVRPNGSRMVRCYFPAIEGGPVSGEAESQKGPSEG